MSKLNVQALITCANKIIRDQVSKLGFEGTVRLLRDKDAFVKL